MQRPAHLHDVVYFVCSGDRAVAGLSRLDGEIRGHRKQAELRALLKRSQALYTRTITTHWLPN